MLCICHILIPPPPLGAVLRPIFDVAGPLRLVPYYNGVFFIPVGRQETHLGARGTEESTLGVAICQLCPHFACCVYATDPPPPLSAVLGPIFDVAGPLRFVTYYNRVFFIPLGRQQTHLGPRGTEQSTLGIAICQLGPHFPCCVYATY